MGSGPTLYISKLFVIVINNEMLIFGGILKFITKTYTNVGCVEQENYFIL